MKCVIYRNGKTRAGRTTVTLERSGATIVVKGVPARICDNCGEEYVGERVASRLIREAEAAADSGTRIHVREYVAA